MFDGFYENFYNAYTLQFISVIRDFLNASRMWRNVFIRVKHKHRKNFRKKITSRAILLLRLGEEKLMYLVK